MVGADPRIAGLLEALWKETGSGNQTQADMWDGLRAVFAAFADVLRRHEQALEQAWSGTAADAFLDHVTTLHVGADGGTRLAAENSASLRAVHDAARAAQKDMDNVYWESHFHNAKRDRIATDPSALAEGPFIIVEGAAIGNRADAIVEEYTTAVAGIPFTDPPEYTPPGGFSIDPTPADGAPGWAGGGGAGTGPGATPVGAGPGPGPGPGPVSPVVGIDPVAGPGPGPVSPGVGIDPVAGPDPGPVLGIDPVTGRPGAPPGVPSPGPGVPGTGPGLGPVPSPGVPGVPFGPPGGTGPVPGVPSVPGRPGGGPLSGPGRSPAVPGGGGGHPLADRGRGVIGRDRTRMPAGPVDAYGRRLPAGASPPVVGAGPGGRPVGQTPRGRDGSPVGRDGVVRAVRPPDQGAGRSGATGRRGTSGDAGGRGHAGAGGRGGVAAAGSRSRGQDRGRDRGRDPYDDDLSVYPGEPLWTVPTCPPAVIRAPKEPPRFDSGPAIGR